MKEHCHLEAATLSRRDLLQIAAALATTQAIGRAGAQSNWPTKPIRLVIGFGPGGGTDIMARVLAQVMSEALGQPIIVDNRPGASGSIAAADVIKSPPDGTSFLIGATSTETANPSLLRNNITPAKDLIPVGGVGRMQMYLVARSSLPVNDAKGLVELARKNPGKLSYASAGAGTPPHLAGELLKQQANIFATHIPYRGSAPALMDVVSGQVDFVYDIGISFPHIRAGRVKLLAVASSKRSPFFPDVPTLEEQGIKGTDLDIWFGAWAPKGTPPEIISRFQLELAKALAQPSVKQRFTDMSAETATLSPADFRKLLVDEERELSTLIRERKIVPD